MDQARKIGEKRTKQTESRRSVSPRPSPATWLLWLYPSPCRLARMGLPWLLQFLERAKCLPDVGLVHAVPSLLAFPSPPLRLAPGLVNSSSPFKHLPQPASAFSTAAALHTCASQTQHRLQRGRPSVGDLEITQVQSPGNVGCPGLGESLSFL